MAKLQIVAFAGVATTAGYVVQIPDGPPLAPAVNIESGAEGVLPGSVSAPLIAKLTPIGGAVNVTWPNSVVETIAGPEFRRLRGETVSVA